MVTPPAETQVSSLSRRKAVQAEVHQRSRKAFGRCDPLNIAVVGAAVAVPALGATLALFAILILLAVVIVLLW